MYLNENAITMVVLFFSHIDLLYTCMYYDRLMYTRLCVDVSRALDMYTNLNYY